jgi:hypothetical protein
LLLAITVCEGFTGKTYNKFTESINANICALKPLSSGLDFGLLLDLFFYRLYSFRAFV